MKKFLFVLFISFFVINGILNSQTNSFVRMGLKATPSISWLKATTKSNLSTLNSDFNFSYGLMLDLYFTERYALATGIDIAHGSNIIGWKEKKKFQPNVDSIVSNIEFKLNTVGIPITLKMKTENMGPLSLFGQFGVGFDVFLNPKGEVQNSTNTRSLMLGKGSLIIGGGAEINMFGSTSFLISVLYKNGLSDILPGQDFGAINNYLNFNVGILF